MPKVFLIHPYVKDLPSMLSFLRLPSCPQGLEWSEEEPDILIATEWIYYKKKLFKRFRELYPKAGLRIGYMQEALELDFNIFDYGVGYSDAFKGNDRFLRLLSPLDIFVNFIDSKENTIVSKEQALEELSRKKGFCSFLYSNANANPMRDRIFYALSEYKKVDSMGKHLNNVGVPGTGFGGHSADCKLLKADYKFGISAENTDFEGGTTEKIFTTLLAHSVPVYWGNPHITDDVNPACFINAADYPDLDALVAKVKEVDADDELWAEMVSAPWFTPEQQRAHVERTALYVEGMNKIISGTMPRRVAEGYHTGLYRKRFFEGNYPKDKSILPFRSICSIFR